MVKLSIIMPVYDASEFLEESLKSIFNQTFEDYEVVCVNDGSNDNSLSILKNIHKEHNNVKIINQENMGSGIARNNAMSEAEGEYLAFLDADDRFLDNDALMKMTDTAFRNDSNMVAANLKRIKPDGSIEINYDYCHTPFAHFNREMIIKPEEYGIPFAFYKNIYKREFIEKNNINFPDLQRGQDPVFLAKVLTEVNEIYTVPIDLYGYNYSVSGGVNIKVNTYSKKKDYIQHFIETFEILERDGFEDMLNNYKKEFIDYLNFRQNIDDMDIQKIVKDSFEGDKYFKESDYGYLIMDSIINSVINTDIEYNVVKHCLFEESMLENTVIEVDRLKTFVNNYNKTEDNELLKSSFNVLKQIENYTFQEKREINGKVDRLKMNIKRSIHSNEEILSSNSWRVTSYLRSLKHKM